MSDAGASLDEILTAVREGVITTEEAVEQILASPAMREQAFKSGIRAILEGALDPAPDEPLARVMTDAELLDHLNKRAGSSKP